MTAPDTMVDVYRRLALTLEPDLEERELPAFGGTGPRVKVSNERGLVVYSATALGAWTAALAACQRRAQWRTMKARRKVATAPPPPPGPPPVGAFWLGQVPTPSEAGFRPIGDRPGELDVWPIDDDQPDGAA